MLTKQCLHCGKEFQYYPSELHANFCSRQCKYDHDKTKITVKCNYCGRDVSVIPSRIETSKRRGSGRIFCNPSCRQKGMSGDKSPLWIDDRTVIKDRRHSERESSKYQEWRRLVFERDQYTCQDCGRSGGYLHAHHIKEWENYPDLRYDVSNGKTVCRNPCHRKYHLARYSNRKILDSQIPEIISMRESGKTLREISKIYNVSESTISVIANGIKRTVPIINGDQLP